MRKFFIILLLSCANAQDRSTRIDCYTEAIVDKHLVNQTLCEKRGCIWNPVDELGDEVCRVVLVIRLVGVHPFYVGLAPDGMTYGVLLWNSNAQEITEGPAPHLIYRTIGGQIEMYFFPGPTFEEVIKQYQQVVGNPFLPAYWALGFQLCRYGYKNLTDMQAAVNRTINAGIPFDVAYADIDYMNEYKDFTYGTEWAGLPEYVDYLHSIGMHNILIFDPALEVDYDPFQRALQQNASFISWPSAELVPQDVNGQYPMLDGTDIMLGVVWPDKHVAFPDFLDPSLDTSNWWMNEVIKFDGMWIDMNEPFNFGTSTNFTNYPDDPKQHNDTQLFCPFQGNYSTFDAPPYQTMSVFQWGNDVTRTFKFTHVSPNPSRFTQFQPGCIVRLNPSISAKNTSYANGYLPVQAHWYSVYDYNYGMLMTNGHQSLPAPTDYLIPVFVRAGYIVPRQKPGMTTVASRMNEFQLLIALANSSNNNFVATGELYWDDGETIVEDFGTHNYYHFLYKFTLNQNTAMLNITRDRNAEKKISGPEFM
uniref:P-type domain-containing protein n=1 Tax=Acrobeloides nanus TaxID=290746 RepID=A0A914EDP5_9BILA